MRIHCTVLKETTYVNKGKFWPNMVWVLVSDHLSLTVWVVADERFDYCGSRFDYFIMNTLSETRIIHPRETTSFPDLSYGSPPREGGGEGECYLVVACRTVSEDKTKYEKSYWTQKRTCPEYDMNLLWNARKILTEFEKVRFPSVVCGLRFRIPTNVLECWQYGYHGKLAGSVSYFV